jgi:hypothetical protein
MGWSRAKQSYLLRKSVDQFYERHQFRCHFLTGTFKDQILDKAEAERRYKPISDWLRRHGIKHIKVWERQRKRGAREGNPGEWHYHALVDHRIDITKFRAFVTARGWGPFCNIISSAQWEHDHRVHLGKGRTVGQYMAKYISKELVGTLDGRVRLVTGTRSCFAGTTKFGWREGLAKAWRAGCDEFLKETKCNPMKYAWSHRDHIMTRGCRVLGLGEWKDIQTFLILSSRKQSGLATAPT